MSREQRRQHWARWVFQFEQGEVLTAEEISRRFRRFLRRFHPDLGALAASSSTAGRDGCAGALDPLEAASRTNAMAAVNEAKTILLP